MTTQEVMPTERIPSELVREDPSFADIVAQFIGGLADRLATMDAALAATDFDALRRAAHQLKGSGGGYGYPVLTQRAAELEKHAQARALDECNRTIAELRRVCGRVVVGTD